MKIRFTDVETTGLHATCRPWDVAIISHDSADDDFSHADVSQYQVFVHPADLDWGNADPFALQIGGFWDRHPHAPLLREQIEASNGGQLPIADGLIVPGVLTYGDLRDLPDVWNVQRLDVIADEIYRMTLDKALIAGSNPAFDQGVLGRAIARIGLKPGWHYHPVDVPTMIEGWIRGRNSVDGHGQIELPAEWKSDALCRAIGIEPDDYARHTALGDCQLFYAAWRVVVGI